MRTVAGPSSAAQGVLSGGPYTVSSPARPGGVPATVPEASLVTFQYFAGA